MVRHGFTHKSIGGNSSTDTTTNTGGSTTPTYSNPSSDVPDVTDEIESITKKMMFNDTYWEIGYITTVADDITTAYDLYITGDITPSSVIENYINNATSATYSGSIASIITDPTGVTSTATGSIGLNFNFGSQSLSGNIEVGSDWKAAINSGSVHKYGFSSSDITTGSGSTVQGITGSMDGKYYGSTANSVGGTFNLNSATSGSVKGVFGASQP